MSQVEIFDQVMMGITNCCREVVAIDCEMVGGGPEGSDGSVDLCARVCMINENEKVIFHSFVKPQLPIKNYRYYSDYYLIIYWSIKINIF